MKIKHGTFLVNQGSGPDPISDEEVEKLRTGLSSGGLNFQIEVIPPDSDLKALVAKLIDQKPAAIVVAGGDGTVRPVASTMIGSSIPLGVLPAGTFNNIARGIGAPTDLAEACRWIAAGNTKPISAGMINEHIFFEAAGCGLDADLFPSGEAIKSGVWTAFIDAVHTIIDAESVKFTIAVRSDADCPAEEYIEEALMVVVANSSHYGSGLQVAPEADMEDPRLVVKVFSRLGKIDITRHFLALNEGKPALHDQVETFFAKELTITTSREVVIHADGDPCGTSPCEIHVIPAALNVFCA